MIKELSMSVEKPHSFGAVLRCALLLILFAVGIETYAQSYNTQSESYRASGAAQSSPAVMHSGFNGSYQSIEVNAMTNSYKAYSGTIYEPFSTSSPSESNSGRRGMSGRRNSDYEGDVSLDGWGDPTTANPGDTSGEFPVGEPWILLAFAAMAAGVVYIRQRKTAVKG